MKSKNNKKNHKNWYDHDLGARFANSKDLTVHIATQRQLQRKTTFRISCKNLTMVQ
jgi:hypothetical protein